MRNLKSPVTSALVLLAAVALPVAPAAADDAWSARSAVAAGGQYIGQFIAAQGNAALEQIKVELEQQMVETLQPLLPEPAKRDASKPDARTPPPA